MHAVSTIKHWVHQLHDEGARVARQGSHVFHERSFWGIVAIMAIIALLFALVVLFGNRFPIQHYGIPTPYGQPYF
jgi:hypothetical protein